MGERVQNIVSCFLRNMDGSVLVSISRGDWVDVLSGPHEMDGDGGWYMVSLRGLIGKMLLIPSELGHPHGPLVPWPTTDAQPVSPQTLSCDQTVAPETAAKCRELAEKLIHQPTNLASSSLRTELRPAIYYTAPRSERGSGMNDSESHATLSKIVEELSAAQQRQLAVRSDGTGPVRAPELESDLKDAREARDAALLELEFVRKQLDIAERKLNLVTSGFKAAELDLQKMTESRDATEAKLAEVTAQLTEARDDSHRWRERAREHEAKADTLREKGHDFDKVVEARNHWQSVAAGRRLELETEKKTTAFLSKEAAAHKAEAERLKRLLMPDFIEWKAQQEQRMTTENKTSVATHPIVKTLTADAEDAAWRLAGSQFVKFTRDPLSALLSRHLGPEDDALRGKVAEFFKTELGASMLSAFLSLGLSSLPEGNGVAPRLARELRVRAMAGATDVVADVITGPLRQVMAMYLQDLPAAPSAPPTLPESTHDRAPITAAVVGEGVPR